MAYTVMIKNIEKRIHIEDDTDFLDVEFVLLDEDNQEVITRRHGFDFNTSAEDIEEDLRKFADSFTHEQELAAKNVAIDALHRNADDIIESLAGKVIEPKMQPNDNSESN